MILAAGFIWGRWHLWPEASSSSRLLRRTSPSLCPSIACVTSCSFGTLRALPCDNGVDISSNGNDDLTELTAALEIAVHFDHLVELERAIDDRLERAARESL